MPVARPSKANSDARSRSSHRREPALGRGKVLAGVGVLLLAVAVPSAWQVRNQRTEPANAAGVPLAGSLGAAEGPIPGKAAIPGEIPGEAPGEGPSQPAPGAVPGAPVPPGVGGSGGRGGGDASSSDPSGRVSSESSTGAGGRTAGPPTFSSIAGEGCQRSLQRGYDKVGVFTQGLEGWYLRSEGGRRGDGCDGSFTAVPMSGSPIRDQRGQFVMWWFVTRPVETGSCRVSVFVPDSLIKRDVAGRPAFYTVQAGRADSTRVGAFAIDQDLARGSWVDAGRYRVTNGEIAVKMGNRGVTDSLAHLGAGQVRVQCRGE
jgi:hypothetical protein